MNNYKQPNINLLITHACIVSNLLKNFNASPKYPINHKHLLDAIMLQSLCGNFVIEGRGRRGDSEFLAPHRLLPELLDIEAAQRVAI